MVTVGAAAEDTIPDSALASLHAIGESLRHSIQGMERWGIHELTLGLYMVALKHSNTKATDTIEGQRVTSRHELESLIQWLQWARAAYKHTAEEMAEVLGIHKQDIVLHETVAAIHQPSYYVALDTARGNLVVGVRGTQVASDVLTDLTPHSEAFEMGFAHSGMLRSARFILKKEIGNICSLLESNPGFEVVTVGHSLGAGTAALLCLLLREEGVAGVALQGVCTQVAPTLARALCWAYACPPCVSRNLAAQTPFITTVVLQDDVVARASPASLEELRAEIVKTDWYQTLPSGSTSKQVFDVCHTASGHMEDALGMERGALVGHAKSLGQTLIASTVKAVQAKAVGGSTAKAVAPSSSSSSSLLWGALSAMATTAVTPPAPSPAATIVKGDGLGAAKVAAPGAGVLKPPLRAQSSSSSSFSWLAAGSAFAGVVAQAAASAATATPEERRDGARRSSSLSSSSSSTSSWLDRDGSSKGGASSSSSVSAGTSGSTLLKSFSGALASAISNIDIDNSSSSSSKGVKAPVQGREGGAVLSGEEREARRLFAPGLLYHLVRTEQQPPGAGGAGRVLKKVPSREDTPSSAADEQEEQSVAYKVIRGSQPQSRFKRIILSNTMLSDHNTKAYMEAMLDALRRLQ